MEPKQKGRIIKVLRQEFLYYPERKDAINKAKVAPATFKCSLCSSIIYTGKKDLDKANILDTYPNAKIGKINVDHIDPVIPLNGFTNKVWDWNEFIDRMFCSSDKLQVLCIECHDNKTDEENKTRLQHRRSKK